MKMLLIHSDYLKYKPTKKALKNIKDVDKKELKFENALVVFACSERSDEKNIKRIVEKSVKEIENKLNEVKAKKIVIYPYAHLSSDLAKPYVAEKVLKELGKELEKRKLPYHISPFGWYKSFEIKCIGHPLSEAFKEITIGEEKEEEIVSKALKEEEKIISHWFIMKPDGEMIPIKIDNGKISGNFDFKNFENLKKFAIYEMAKSREVKKPPVHIKMMRDLELADYESASDSGNLRFYPNGRLIKSLLEQFITRKVIDYGAMEIESPLMYSITHPAAVAYLNKFPARQYIIKSGDKEFFLRFAACFGQFCMANNMNISYKDLPIRLYELTRYSFRRERKSELAGLRRLRAFTMPDVHAFCADLPQAMKEFERRFKLSQAIINDIGFKKEDYELAIRFTKDFYNEHKDFIKLLMKLHGKPALIEMWDKRAFYFILKYEFNIVDASDKASALSTDQIDIENAKRYGITYIDKDNKKKNPIILHCSPSGAIERVIYALLEKAYIKQKNGEVPEFPLWLSPVQIRIIPVSDKFIKPSEELMKNFEEYNIRVDIDDRALTVQKRIREAELDWVNLIIVFGEKENESKKLMVRIHKTKEIKTMSFDEIVKYVTDKTKGYPFIPLSLPKLLSKRPIFVG
ncbi:MAG: threonine--tRNA ligase [Candidatus Aenigmarchaeota archaeon]|nr:threonine--tRNA ligase [Candidatus Aenigmarchaeota archaeon]